MFAGSSADMSGPDLRSAGLAVTREPRASFSCDTSAVTFPSRAAIWLCLVAPLAWIPGGMDRFVFPKLVVTAAAIALGALGARQGRLPKAIQVVTGVGVVIFVLACLFSPTPVASFIGRWPRYEGLPVVATYIGSAWLGARLLGNRTRAATEDLVKAVAVSSLLLGAFSLFDALGWHVQGASAESRTGSLLGNATDQGLVAMMLFSVLFGVAVERREPLLLVATAVAPLTVALSGSRTALLITVVVVGIHVGARRRPVLVRGGAVALVAIGGLALALPQIRDRLAEGQPVTGRLLLWKESLQVGGHRWWLGGPSTFVDAVGRYRDEDWVREVGTSSPPDSPHAWPLQALVAGGVPLLVVSVVLAGLIVMVGWRAVRREPDALTVGLFAATIGYGVGVLPNFTIAGSTCLAAFFVGALVAVPARRTEPILLPRVVAGLAVLAVVAFSSAALAERSIQTGVAAAARGDVAAADAAFQRARHLRPFDGDVAMFAAQSLAGAANDRTPGAAPLAERWARRSLARTPDTYASGLALAVAQISRNELPAAKDTLDGLIARFPTEPDARIQRGIARFGLQDVDGARSDLRLAHHLQPRNPVPGRILKQITERLNSP